MEYFLKEKEIYESFMDYFNSEINVFTTGSWENAKDNCKLQYSFDWKRTIDGFDYWNDINTEYRKRFDTLPISPESDKIEEESSFILYVCYLDNDSRADCVHRDYLVDFPLVFCSLYNDNDCPYCKKYTACEDKGEKK